MRLACNKLDNQRRLFNETIFKPKPKFKKAEKQNQGYSSQIKEAGNRFESFKSQESNHEVLGTGRVWDERKLDEQELVLKSVDVRSFEWLV